MSGDVIQGETLALYASGVIHQLRNQLTVIRNCSYTLDQYAQDQDAQPQLHQVDSGGPHGQQSGGAGVHSSVELAAIAVGRAYDLVVAFSNFAWCPRNGVQEVDLNSTLRHLKELVGYDLMQRDVSLELQLEEVPPLLLHKIRVYELLLHLFHHIALGMPKGGLLRVSTRALPGTVTLSFRADRQAQVLPGPVVEQELKVLRELAQAAGVHLEVSEPGPTLVVEVCFSRADGAGS